MNQTYNCIPNPFINTDYILLNLNEISYQICNNSMNNTIDQEYCDKQCLKDCNQEYYSLDFDNKYIIPESNSTIRINYQNYAEFQYKAEPKNTFILYLSDIGGLIGLWFGLSFIDLNILFKSFFKKIQSKLEFFISLEYFYNIPYIIYLKRKIMKYLIILHKIKKLKWKSIFRTNIHFVNIFLNHCLSKVLFGI